LYNSNDDNDNYTRPTSTRGEVGLYDYRICSLALSSLLFLEKGHCVVLFAGSLPPERVYNTLEEVGRIV